MSGIKCPQCGAWSAVLDTRTVASNNTVRRRNECANLHRFSTVERVEVMKLGGQAGLPRGTRK